MQIWSVIVGIQGDNKFMGKWVILTDFARLNKTAEDLDTVFEKYLTAC